VRESGVSVGDLVSRVFAMAQHVSICANNERQDEAPSMNRCGCGKHAIVQCTLLVQYNVMHDAGACHILFIVIPAALRQQTRPISQFNAFTLCPSFVSISTCRRHHA
jgi:hypothetical protein